MSLAFIMTAAVPDWLCVPQTSALSQAVGRLDSSGCVARRSTPNSSLPKDCDLIKHGRDALVSEDCDQTAFDVSCCDVRDGGVAVCMQHLHGAYTKKCNIYTYTHTHTNTHTDRQTDRQTDRHLC